MWTRGTTVVRKKHWCVNTFHTSICSSTYPVRTVLWKSNIVLLFWTAFNASFRIMISKSTFYLKCVIFYIQAGPSHAYVLSHVWIFATLWTVTCQASLSFRCSRQEYLSKLPFPSAGIFLTHTFPVYPALAGRFFIASATWDPIQAGEGSQFWGEKNIRSKKPFRKTKNLLKILYLNI